MTTAPFHTTNLALALALQIVGFKPKLVQKIYTPAKLREMGCGSVAEAMKRNRMGEVFFYFELTDELKAAKDAWFAMAADIKKGNAEAVAEFSSVEAMRIACVFSESRKIMFDRIAAMPGILVETSGEKIDNRGDDGYGVVKLPGFKMISTNASPELREKLDL